MQWPHLVLHVCITGIMCSGESAPHPSLSPLDIIGNLLPEWGQLHIPNASSPLRYIVHVGSVAHEVRVGIVLVRLRTQLVGYRKMHLPDALEDGAHVGKTIVESFSPPTLTSTDVAGVGHVQPVDLSVAHEPRAEQHAEFEVGVGHGVARGIPVRSGSALRSPGETCAREHEPREMMLLRAGARPLHAPFGICLLRTFWGGLLFLVRPKQSTYTLKVDRGGFVRHRIRRMGEQCHPRDAGPVQLRERDRRKEDVTFSPFGLVFRRGPFLGDRGRRIRILRVYRAPSISHGVKAVHGRPHYIQEIQQAVCGCFAFFASGIIPTGLQI
mmetsp:Transcript_29241/g.70535  ORF Transcript_29241/g.70535 Transcript_29241/m.70535 type:complete len:326 (-) Transcript_29241:1014-1991(-)